MLAYRFSSNVLFSMRAVMLLRPAAQREPTLASPILRWNKSRIVLSQAKNSARFVPITECVRQNIFSISTKIRVTFYACVPSSTWTSIFCRKNLLLDFYCVVPCWSCLLFGPSWPSSLGDRAKRRVFSLVKTVLRLLHWRKWRERCCA